jgi:uncharacterized lipoprotein YbaY
MKGALALFASAVALGLSGCGQLNVAPEGNPDRVLTGTIELSDAAALPADAEAVVRVVDSSDASAPPKVLGSETVRNLGTPPVEFRVEYRAEDEQLRRGLNVEARISYGGKVRYYNMNHYVVTFGNAADPHRISVVPTGP